MKKSCLVLLLGSFFVCMLAHAQIPKTISYQGFLSTGGTPDRDTLGYMKFKFYTVFISGAAIWTETDTVPIHNGSFSVILGKNSPLDSVNLNQKLYLEIAIGSDPPLTPRTELTSAPYSLAPWSSNGGGINYTYGNVGIGTSNPQNLLHVGPGTSTIGGSRVNEVVASTTTDAGIAIADNNGVNLLLQASGAGGYIGTVSDHGLVMRTHDMDRMVIDSSGYVGVGTGSPATLLHVGPGGGGFPSDLLTVSGSGNTGISVRSGTTGSDYPTVRFYRGSTQVGYIAGEDGKKLMFFNTQPNAGITVDSTGSVGIGTLSPLSTLDIDGGSTGYAGLRATVHAVQGSGTFNTAAEGSASNADFNTGVNGSGYGGSSAVGVEGFAANGTFNYAGYFDGDLAYTGSLIHASDEKFKDNIESCTGALSRLMTLQPRTFTYKTGPEYDRFGFSRGRQYGFIAQELEKVFPDMVVTAVQPPERDAQGHVKGEPVRYKAIKPLDMIPILVEAIQELKAQIERQGMEIKALRQGQETGPGK